MIHNKISNTQPVSAGSSQVDSAKLNKLVALFLSEILRSRRTSLARAAEISAMVTQGLKNLKTEDQVLAFLSQIQKEFEEVEGLKQALHFGFTEFDCRAYEREIKQHASDLFQRDMSSSTLFLQDASRRGVSIQELCLKYPDFCRYLTSVNPSNPEIIAMAPALVAA